MNKYEDINEALDRLNDIKDTYCFVHWNDETQMG